MPVHLMPRRARRIIPAVVVATALAAAVAGGLAAPAMADTSSIAVATSAASPEQAFPVDLSFSGTNALTGAAEVEAIVRPAGGPACETSYQEDTTTFQGQDTAIVAPGAQTVAPGAYQVAASFRPPAPGSYQLCAWLAQNQNSTDQPVASPATLAFTARGPQVSQLTVAVPKDLQPHVSFQVSYTTQTDQPLTLHSVLRPAADAPCPATFSLDQQQNQPETNLLGFGTQPVFGGPTTTTATTKQKTGFYVICSWVQGPTADEVDGTATTPVTVGTPPPPKPGLTLTKATASRGHGVSVAGTAVSGFNGKLVVGVACGSATARRTTTAHNRRFASSVRLPSGCRAVRKVRLTVSWAGSSAFSKQSVAKTVAIAR
ncbi:MAG TPA: hypothetical protein VHW96_02760 [Solirubrobacteraceae bacterium]|nr:hypothetical protein [Solirubrobacteraceae bacterium]